MLIPWYLVLGSAFTLQMCLTSHSLSKSPKPHPGWRNKASATRNLPGSLYAWEFSETSSKLQDWALDPCKLPCPVSYSIPTPDPFKRVGYRCLDASFIHFFCYAPKAVLLLSPLETTVFQGEKVINAQGIPGLSTGQIFWYHSSTEFLKVLG